MKAVNTLFEIFMSGGWFSERTYGKISLIIFMEDTKYQLNNTENTIGKLKKAYKLDDEFIDAIKQSVIADIKANIPKNEKSSSDKILELAKKNRVI